MSQRKVDELVETINPEEQVVDWGVRQHRPLKTTSNVLTLSFKKTDG